MGFPVVHLTSNPKPMGLAVDGDLLLAHNPEVNRDTSIVEGKSAHSPADLQKVNTTYMEEPLRRLMGPNGRRILAAPTTAPCLPAEPVIDAVMAYVAQFRSRSTAPIPSDITPVFNQRVAKRMPVGAHQFPDDEWVRDPGRGALLYAQEWAQEG